MSYTEFTCRSGGSNLYAGTLDGSAEASTTPLATYTSGNWVQGTGVFTVASGNPVSDGVAVGQWASVYNDGASAPAVFVGRITARDATTITVSLTAKSGTAPTDGTGNRTLVVGGAWAGPSGASAFPFGFVQNTMTNSAGDAIRANGKTDQTYSVTAAMTHGNAGPFVWEGYTSTFGDGGRCTISGGTSGASYVVFTLSGANVAVRYTAFQNNGATGSANLVANNASGTQWHGCVFTGSRGTGWNNTGGNTFVRECEAYANNASNTSALGGFVIGGGTVNFTRCISRNSQSNAIGFNGSNVTALRFDRCIASGNGNIGFNLGTNNLVLTMTGCEAYANGSDGFRFISGTTPTVYAENCNAVLNGGYGLNVSGSSSIFGFVRNFGFGSGAAANTSGATNIISALDVAGTVTYPSGSTPWADPANGDFRINLTEAKGAGRGAFAQTQAGQAGTVGYPDIGAAQHQETASTGTFRPYRVNGRYVAS